jgi:hypothetical protein
VTTAKPHHRSARALLIRYLDMHPGKRVGNDLDPAEVGIIGDTAHAAGGDSYHLGRDKIRARAGRDRYSVDESARDQRGLDNEASAMDVGFFQVKTVRGVFDLRDFSVWLVGLCIAGDPDTRDIREVIYSPDGRTVRRWDRQKRRTSGDDSHLFHTHLSEYRDADGRRMVALATRWLQHIGLLPEEDDMPTPKDLLDYDGVPNVYPSGAGGANITVRAALKASVSADVKLSQVLAQLKLLTGKDFTDEQAIISGVLAGLDPSVIAAAIPAELAQQVADELIARLQG